MKTDKFIKILKQYIIIEIKHDLPLLTQINKNKMEKIDKNNLNSLCKVNCEQYGMAFIGETDRKFSTRLKEYETSWILKNGKSLFRKHTNDKQQHTNN